MDNISIAQAAKRLLELQEAATSFPKFMAVMFPQFKVPPFHMELMETLDAFEKGTLGKQKLMVNMPVRHGKTFLFSVAFPVYYMARRPSRKILASSYGADLANTIGKDVRNLAQEPAVSQIFPKFELAKDSQAANDWRTTLGGKYFACGLDGSTSGRPANLLIWDDLLKNRAAADSPTERNRAWSHYVSALVKRLEPEIDNTPALEIGIMTRWHQDDPCGRLMEGEDYKEGDWHHIIMPAISKKPSQIKMTRDMLPPDDPRWVPVGDLPKLPRAQRDVFEEIDTPLWPERFPLSYLEKQRRLDPHEFSALFQQEPFTKGGNILKSTWWRIYTKEELPTTFATLIVAVDTAFKDGEQSDYSVFITAGLSHSGDIYILDVVRERLQYPDLKRRMLMINSLWRGKGLRGIYIEDKASGQSLIQDLRRESGIAVLPVKTLRDKVSRLNSVSPLIEGGRVFIPDAAPWLDEFLNETQAFPNSKHDDQVDALTMALDALSRVSVGAFDAINTPLEMSTSLFNQFSNVTPITKNSAKKFSIWGE
jgi:predicted phage terminase large subunit-like protein